MMATKMLRYVSLLVVVVLAIFVRLYKISEPLLDWHSFRQADTASVTREYVKHGIDVLRPTYHDHSNIQSGKDNLQGYRMVEFPLLNAGTAVLIQTFNLEEKEVVVGRIVSIALSVCTLLGLFMFGKRVSGYATGFVAALLFAILPYSVYYSRVILPEPALLASLVWSFVLYDMYLEKKNIVSLLGAIVLFAVALLLKPYALFFLPVLGALALMRQGIRSIGNIWMYIGVVLSIIPLVLWRRWILQFPEGIPASDWLFNKENIRLTGAFFHWLFEVRIFTLILGIGLVVPCILGMLKKGRDWFVYVVFAGSMMLYLVILAGGNVQHDYYQILLLPFLCLATARGIVALWDISPLHYHMWITRGATVILIGFSLFVSWYSVRGYYNVNHWELVKAGRAADQMLPQDAKVIAPYMGDTAFLFQTNRTGWPIGFEIEDKIKMGAQYYVSPNYDDETNDLLKKYAVVVKTPDVVILDLQKPQNETK